MQASKNCKLFWKRKINLHYHTHILYVYWFIYPDMPSHDILVFFRPIRPLVNESSKSRYLEFSPGVISLSQSRAISKIALSWTFCPVPSGFEIAGLDCNTFCQKWSCWKCPCSTFKDIALHVKKNAETLGQYSTKDSNYSL